MGARSATDEERTDAVLVLESSAFAKDPRRREERIGMAMPVPLAWLAEAGLGRKELRRTAVVRGRLVAFTDRVYAGKTLETVEEPPPREMLCRAAAAAVIRKQWHGGILETLVQRHRDRALLADLEGKERWPALAAWLEDRLAGMGVEEPGDLDLVEAEDLLPEELDPYSRDRLRRDFPERISTGDATYELEYRVAEGTIVLHQVAGLRKTAPPEHIWPRRHGWKLVWLYKNRERSLKR